MGFAVTEPTPLGKHDLILILELMEKLGVESKVILNKSDISDKKGIIETVQKYKSSIVAGIPYSKEIEERYSKGIPIKHPSIEKIAKELR